MSIFPVALCCAPTVAFYEKEGYSGTGSAYVSSLYTNTIVLLILRLSYS